MIFKTSIQTILLGFAIWFCLLVGIGQNPIMAVTLAEFGSISQERMQTLPEEPLNLAFECNLVL